MSADTYRDILAESGLMKFRATALLAYGDNESRFEAAVLLHDVVRLETKAFALLKQRDAMTFVRFSVECCACLIDGLDPRSATIAWQNVEQNSLLLDPVARKAMLSRIEPRWAVMGRAFREAIQRAPALFPPGKLPMPVAQHDIAGRAREREQLAPLLQEYPGVAHFWYRQCYLDYLAENASGAWHAVQRAVRLEPETVPYRAVFLWFAPQMLAPGDPDIILSPEEQENAVFRVGLMLGSAEAAANAQVDVERIRHLRRVERLRALPLKGGDARFSRLLRAVELLARDIEELRAPSDNALRQTGFEDLISRAPKTITSPMKLLAAEMLFAAPLAA